MTTLLLNRDSVAVLPALRFFGIQKLSFYRDASILSGVGVGGGSLVYANTLFHPPDEFFNHASWNHLGSWKKTLQPFYEKAAFMMGRTRYDKKNIEDQFLFRVADKMDRADTYDTVQVGVYLNDKEGNKIKSLENLISVPVKQTLQ